MLTIIKRPFPDRFISEAGFASDENQFASERLILFAHTCIVTQIYDLVACVRLAYRGTGIRK